MSKDDIRFELTVNADQAIEQLGRIRRVLGAEDLPPGDYVAEWVDSETIRVVTDE